MTELANSTDIFNAVTGKIKDGYFVKDASCKENKICSFVATRDYRKFEFILGVRRDRRAELTPEFTKRVNELQKFNQSDHENVEKWKRFFNDFGTHVVVGAGGGGRIQFRFSIPYDTPVKSAVEDVLKTVDLLDDLSSFVLNNKKNPKEVIANASKIPHTLVFNGGNQAYHISDLLKLTLEEAVPLFRKWKKSLDFYPSVFPHASVSMAEVIENFISKSAAEKFDEPFRRLLTSTLIYIPPPPPTPDPKILEDIARQKKETAEKLRKLEEEKKRAEKEAELLRLAEIAAQKRREEEIRKENERKQQQLREIEAKRLRQEEENRRRLREDEDRRRREREQTDRRNRERQQAIEAEARRERERAEERHRQWVAEQRRRNSCLKKGTKILLADYTEKAVELLKVGDILLDQELKPSRVLGVAYEFLLEQKFYGFDNNSFFFTDTHLFAGESGESNSSTLYTTSTKHLYTQNPLLEYLNVREFCNNEKGGVKCNRTRLTYFDGESKKPVQRKISIFEEPKVYPEDTLIYFIQVDSPTGTYFAEGFVCRHELPPVEHWPNTLAVLFSVLGTKAFNTLGELPYTLETIQVIDRISANVRLAVGKAIETNFFMNYSEIDDHMKVEKLGGNECEEKVMNSFDLDEVVGRFYSNPTVSALGMELYGGSGVIIAKYLDNPEVNVDDCKMARIQNILFDVISHELESFRSSLI